MVTRVVNATLITTNSTGAVDVLCFLLHSIIRPRRAHDELLQFVSSKEIILHLVDFNTCQFSVIEENFRDRPDGLFTVTTPTACSRLTVVDGHLSRGDGGMVRETASLHALEPIKVLLVGIDRENILPVR